MRKSTQDSFCFRKVTEYRKNVAILRKTKIFKPIAKEELEELVSFLLASLPQWVVLSPFSSVGSAKRRQ